MVEAPVLVSALDRTYVVGVLDHADGMRSRRWSRQISHSSASVRLKQPAAL